MNILVIGSGGREHALCWKLAKSEKSPKVFCAPGNAGIAQKAECVDISPGNLDRLLKFAREKRIDLTVVGPETPLAAGIVDLFQGNDLKIFGPTKSAARLESSKIFTKEFCTRHSIPTGTYQIFDDAAKVKDSVKNGKFPVVIKADGLAAGKGVSICQTKEEAFQAIDKMLVERVFGESGNRIVVEEFLKGREVSFMAFVDGENILPLSSAKDHKRLLEGDEGPNTGGMGAYSPAPNITQTLYDKVMDRIMKPTVKGMREEETPFVGVLYAGLMIDEGEPKLLEFNVRLGDPEAQVVLPRLKTDFVELIEMSLEGGLEDVLLSWETRPSACIVMASRGYPAKYETGFTIQGLQEGAKLTDVVIFHAGTKLKNGEVVTAGGRVLGVTALGEDMPRALDKAYEAADKISWEGSFYRRDIGKGIQ